MVKNRVQAFKNGLLGQVHLVDEQPVALLDRGEENTVAPFELDLILVVITFVCSHSFAYMHGRSACRILRAKQVHHISLLAQVDSDQFAARDSRHLLDESSLTHTWWAFDQDWLAQRIGSQELHQVCLRRFCMESKLVPGELLLTYQFLVERVVRHFELAFCVFKMTELCLIDIHCLIRREMRLDQLLKIVLTSVDYGCLLGFAGRVDTKAYSVYDDEIYGLFEALMALHFIAIDFHEVYDAKDIPDRESLALEGLELGVF